MIPSSGPRAKPGGLPPERPGVCCYALGTRRPQVRDRLQPSPYFTKELTTSSIREASDSPPPPLGGAGALRGPGRWGRGWPQVGWAGGKLLLSSTQLQLLGAGVAVPPPPPPAPFTRAPALSHKPRSPWRLLLQVTPGDALRHCSLGTARPRECAAGFFHPSHLHFPAPLPLPPAPPPSCLGRSFQLALCLPACPPSAPLSPPRLQTPSPRTSPPTTPRALLAQLSSNV